MRLFLKSLAHLPRLFQQEPIANVSIPTVIVFGRNRMYTNTLQWKEEYHFCRCCCWLNTIYDGLEDNGGMCKAAWIKKSTWHDVKSWLIAPSTTQTRVSASRFNQSDKVWGMRPPTALYGSILGNLRFRFIRLDPLNSKNLQLSYLHIESINLWRREKKEYFMGGHFD